ERADLRQRGPAVRGRGGRARPRRSGAGHGRERAPPQGRPALAPPGRAPRAADGDRLPQRPRLPRGPARGGGDTGQRRRGEGDPRPRHRPAQARSEEPGAPRADPVGSMTVEEYTRLPREARLARLARTSGELAAAIGGRTDDALSRRPDATNWAAKEVLCHLRDNEESFLDRLQMMVAMDEPRFPRSDPNRWAEERQYLSNDATEALHAFGRRRGRPLTLLASAGP